MPKMKKGNRVLTAEDTDKNFYLDQGYDEVQFNESTKKYDIVTKATGGKNYTIKQYNAVVEESDALKVENARLIQQLETTKKENETLKKKLKE